MTSLAIALGALLGLAGLVAWLVVTTKRSAAVAAKNDAALSDFTRAEKIHEDAAKAETLSRIDRRPVDDRLRDASKLRDG